MVAQAQGKYFRPLAREQYQKLSSTDLVSIVVDKDDAIRALRAQVAALKKELQSTSQQLVAVREHEGGDDRNAQWLVQRNGKYASILPGHLSPQCQMAICIRKAVGNMSAASLGAALMDDISRNTVVRCENLAGAALNCWGRAWHRECEAEVKHLAVTKGGVSFVSESFSSDATNSAVWRGEKLIGLHLDAVYVFPNGRARSFAAFADLLPARFSNYSGVHAAMRKQLDGLGSPPWCFPASPDVPLIGRIIRLWFVTSDGGPDQTAFKKALLWETEPDPWTIVMTCHCFMHVTQLIYRSGLEMVDQWLAEQTISWRYFSSLTKLCQVWRELSQRIQANVLNDFGPLAARQHCSSLPPRCIAGRWGTVYATEAFVFGAPA